MRRFTQAITVVFCASALLSWPIVASATDKSKTLTPDNITTAELSPGESISFHEGDVATIETIPQDTNLQWVRMAAQQTTAPNCIIAKKEKGFIQVYNNCHDTQAQRIKVTLAFGLDTACTSIEPGTRVNVGLALGRIDGVYLC